jgi:hypothetical protein
VTATRQLTLDVHPHTEAARREHHYIAGNLRIAGDYSVPHDLHAGDELTVTVANADGQVIAQALARVGAVTLTPIEDKDLGVIGTERVHKAKVVA